ncbi:MAG: type II toxin-antitoxin system Phd/YefM family antitoxin [Patescibacteria group bacterium]
MNNVIPISQARASLPQLVDEAAVRKAFITVKGKVKAVLMDPEELASMEATMEILSDPEAMKAIRQGVRDIENGDLIPWEQVKKEWEQS